MRVRSLRWRLVAVVFLAVGVAPALAGPRRDQRVVLDGRVPHRAQKRCDPFQRGIGL